MTGAGPTGSSSDTGMSSGTAGSSMDTGATTSPSASSATTYGQGASVTVQTLTNGPVPDTRENRQRYGGPMSHAGRRTAPKGN
jgi:hypothetical protein